jgi:hypothetical protein
MFAPAHLSAIARCPAARVEVSSTDRHRPEAIVRQHRAPQTLQSDPGQALLLELRRQTPGGLSIQTVSGFLRRCTRCLRARKRVGETGVDRIGTILRPVTGKVNRSRGFCYRRNVVPIRPRPRRTCLPERKSARPWGFCGRPDFRAATAGARVRCKTGEGEAGRPQHERRRIEPDQEPVVLGQAAQQVSLRGQRV